MTERVEFTITSKSCMAAAAILNFGKCQYLRIKWGHLLQVWWEDALRPCGDGWM